MNINVSGSDGCNLHYLLFCAPLRQEKRIFGLMKSLAMDLLTITYKKVPTINESYELTWARLQRGM
jgi:hypothetical protein